MKLILIAFFLFTSTIAEAYTLRNTYQSKLICTQIEKPHTRYAVLANPTKNYDKIPTAELKAAGKYNCITADKLYTSTCSVSELQPTATFDINEGSASCSTPVKSNQAIH